MPKFNTNDIFKPGKLSVMLDGSAGSSGKGKLGAFICKHADNWQFACNTYMPQAGHTCKEDDGKTYFYQTLNSCAYLNNYEKLYIGPGGMIEVPSLFKEIEQSNVDLNKIGIHPLVSILQEKDAAFERGEVDLDGNKLSSLQDGTMKKGSTCHGCGAARARKILRRPDVLLAKDVPELKPFLCDTTQEIKNRLENGQAGLLEIAQGFQLSYLSQFYPYCTSRNCTVAAALDDMMLPPIYAGNVIINMRSIPIRINNKKFLGDNGKHLTWEEVEEYKTNNKPYKTYMGNSGPGYNDQYEITWEKVAELANVNFNTFMNEQRSAIMTSVTKLPRRPFTFSKKSLDEAIFHNQTGHTIFIAVNFANYIDYSLCGRRGNINELTTKIQNWLNDNIMQSTKIPDINMKFIGTGPLTDDMILVS